MSSIENFRQNLRRLIDEAPDLTAAELSARVSTHKTLVRDILNGRTKQPKKTTREKIAHALGVSLEDMEAAEPKLSNCFAVDLKNSITAKVMTLEAFDDGNYPIIDLLIVAVVGDGDPHLYTLSRVGDAMMVFETDHNGFKGAPMPYTPSGGWHIGKVVLAGHERTFRTIGPVQSLTIPCNLHIDLS